MYNIINFPCNYVTPFFIIVYNCNVARYKYIMVYWPHFGTEQVDNSVGIAIKLRLDDRGIDVRFPAGARCSSLPVVQITNGAHPASSTMGTADYFPVGKAGGA